MKLGLDNLRVAAGAEELLFDVEAEGRLIGLFGPSGAGKTTLLETIAGLRQAAGGRIVLDGRVLCDGRRGLPPHRRGIGYVPQDLALFPHLDVRSNLRYGMPASADRDRLPAISEILEITPFLGRLPEKLSGGEKQRVALARAVLANPSLLLLDEPFSSLDHALKQRILPHVLRIRDEVGIPILYVTHSAEEIMQLCDHLIVIDRGRIASQGPPSGLLLPSHETRYRLRPADE